MGEFSITHLLLLAIIFLIFFGPSRLPQLGQSLGKAIRGFKQGLSEIDAEAKDVQDPRNVAPQQQNLPPNYQGQIQGQYQQQPGQPQYGQQQYQQPQYQQQPGQPFQQPQYQQQGQPQYGHAPQQGQPQQNPELNPDGTPKKS